MIKVLVIGKDGQLGKSIQKLVADANRASGFTFVGRRDLDLCRKDSIDHYFEANNEFDVVVNCAAYTAVDKAENEQDLANQINHFAVGWIAKTVVKQGVRLIHISTDYVFDGEIDRPYKELDQTNPVNVYGKSKLDGEKAIQRAMPMNAIIIRTSWLYSEYGRNFVTNMLKIGREKGSVGVVCDQIGSPTYAGDLAKVILDIIYSEEYCNKVQPTEIYHYSNIGRASWYEFASKVFQIAEIDCKVRPITTDQYPTLAKRPVNTLMDKRKIFKKFGLSGHSWASSLRSCLESL